MLKTISRQDFLAEISGAKFSQVERIVHRHMLENFTPMDLEIMLDVLMENKQFAPANIFGIFLTIGIESADYNKMLLILLLTKFIEYPRVTMNETQQLMQKIRKVRPVFHKLLLAIKNGVFQFV